MTLKSTNRETHHIPGLVDMVVYYKDASFPQLKYMYLV